MPPLSSMTPVTLGGYREAHRGSSFISCLQVPRAVFMSLPSPPAGAGLRRFPRHRGSRDFRRMPSPTGRRPAAKISISPLDFIPKRGILGYLRIVSNEMYLITNRPILSESWPFFVIKSPLNLVVGEIPTRKLMFSETGDQGFFIGGNES